MEKTENIEDFYQTKFNKVPEGIKKEVGHFNVFSLDDFVGVFGKPIPYSRKDYYKITLIIGRNRYHYADKTIEINGPALLFANPMIPYNWEPLDDNQTGYFCVFTPEFLNNFGGVKSYPVFEPGQTPIYQISHPELESIESLFLQMTKEMQSDYGYKYDLIKTIIIQLIYKALKMVPALTTYHPRYSENERITSLFSELLERQFPIESPFQTTKLRTPSDFARHMAIHVNHLNRALKETTGKTTSQHIADRMLQEAKILLKHTDWNISQIGYSLGFEEASRFFYFFKKQTAIPPRSFRKLQDV
jgi:AraC-like DNA-binding protein